MASFLGEDWNNSEDEGKVDYKLFHRLSLR